MSINGGIQCYYWLSPLLPSCSTLYPQGPFFYVWPKMWPPYFLGMKQTFMALLFYLQKNSQTIDGVFRCRTNILCLLGAFLFVGGFANKGSMMLLSVIEVVHCDQTHMLHVVADTILFLDHICHHLVKFSQATHCCCNWASNPLGLGTYLSFSPAFSLFCLSFYFFVSFSFIFLSYSLLTFL